LSKEQAMHIPNGFLTDPVCAATTLASAAALGYGIARLRRDEFASSAPLMAATGAGIFAAQMVNFPIDGATSGHVIGAALAAIALGPWRGMLTMTIVLAVQSLVFGDGGLAVLGANVLNMAVVSTLVSWGVYQFTTRRLGGMPGQLAGAGAAAFASVLAAAVACSAELAISGTFAAGEVLSAMLSVHLVIALCEGLITVSIVAAAMAISAQPRLASPRNLAIVGIAAAIAVAALLAPLASSSPDGLERVAENLNFAALAVDTFAIVPEYELPGVSSPLMAVALAGVFGVAIVAVASYAIGRTATVRVRKQ